MWVDSHCHLSQLKLNDNDTIDAALQRARASKVKAFLCIATDIANTEQIQALCSVYDDVWTSAGIHPLNLQQDQQDQPWQQQLELLAKAQDCVAIGETGLDFHYASAAEEQQFQLQSFAFHIELSEKLNKPLIIHTREAKEATLEVLQSSKLSKKPGVIHCFTEDLDMAEAFIELGFYISFSGIVTFKNAEKIQHAMRNIPLDRILIETDSPYLAPVPFRGKPNFPEYVVKVGEFIAQQRNLSLQLVAKTTTQNFCDLFNIDL
jgi:TatD DNase family protein